MIKKVLQMALDYITEVDYGPYDSRGVIAALNAALSEKSDVDVAKIIERERCARLCEQLGAQRVQTNWQDCAAAIRGMKDE